ncbi:hypothetical protein TURU_039594 [Turdus rufiventris]|nr:hypothetical protein TURU_039594 [Turdus rufiventris]
MLTITVTIVVTITVNIMVTIVVTIMMSIVVTIVVTVSVTIVITNMGHVTFSFVKLALYGVSRADIRRLRWQLRGGGQGGE